MVSIQLSMRCVRAILAGLMGMQIFGHSFIPADVTIRNEQTRESNAIDLNKIVPGTGLNNIVLGQLKDQVIRSFPVKPRVDADVTYANCGFTYEEIHWLDVKLSPPGSLWFHFKDNHLVQIRSSDPRFRTVGGLTLDSSPEEVRKQFPNLRALLLTNSASQFFHGKNLVYWVDEALGIAFEFFYNKKVHARRVYSVFVFKPGSKFLPLGCVEPPQEWHELRPFTFE